MILDINVINLQTETQSLPEIMSICLSIYLSIYLSILYIYLYLYLSLYLSIYISIFLYLSYLSYLSLYLSISLSLYLSIYLSIDIDIHIDKDIYGRWFSMNLQCSFWFSNWPRKNMAPRCSLARCLDVCKLKASSMAPGRCEVWPHGLTHVVSHKPYLLQ